MGTPVSEVPSGNVLREWAIRNPSGRCWCAQLPRISEEPRGRVTSYEGCSDPPEQDSLERGEALSSCPNGQCPPPRTPKKKKKRPSSTSSAYSFFAKRMAKASNGGDKDATPPPSPIPDARKDIFLTEASSRDMEEAAGQPDISCGLCGDRKGESLRSLWVILSALYGKLLVLLMGAICLTEVLDNNVRPLSLQSVYLIYLYVGSVAAILGIYVSVLLDSCPSLGVKGPIQQGAADPDLGSLYSFGTLKRAHISRAGTSRTSFYLRVGALVFGLGTLTANGLEVAMETTLEAGCMDSVTSAVPILQALFTFLQMHFLFVNSEVLVERYGMVARFGFMHLMATNIALWLRAVIWGGAKDWLSAVHRDSGSLDFTSGGVQALKATNEAFAPLGLYNHGPPLNASTVVMSVSNSHLRQMISLIACTNNTSLGQLWNSWRTLLFPFIVQYSLIAAAVTYMMWKDVGRRRQKHTRSKSTLLPTTPPLTSPSDQPESCHNASKGLFFGLLCLVGSLVVAIIFFVMKSHRDFRPNLFWMCAITQIILLTSSSLACGVGFSCVRSLTCVRTVPRSTDLDRLVPHVCVVGVYIYAILSVVVGAAEQSPALVAVNVLLAMQVTLQTAWSCEAARRACSTRSQIVNKPGRQVVTFLLFANIAMWLLDTFVTHDSASQVAQTAFYGPLVWGVVMRTCLPLLIMYRFHACVVMAGIWKRAYRLRLK